MARWDGETWEELGGGVESGVTALTAHPSGLIYVGGYFTFVGDSIPSPKFAIWDQSDRPVSIQDRQDAETANRIALDPAFPNPFNPSTVIGYHLAVGGQTSLIVYNVLGRHL